MTKLSCAQCRPPCPLGDLSPQETWALNGLMRSVSFPSEQALFEQGDPQSGCYLLCEGVAVLRARTCLGKRLIIGLVGPHDIVGVGSFLGQQRHELSVHALTEVRALHLTKAACDSLMREPSVLVNRLCVVMARQVRQLRRQARLLAARAGVRERLAALLMDLAERYGEPTPAGLRLKIQLSCELLGQMLDSHRSTVNLELIKLERRGLIERVSRQIVIVDEARLRDLAQSLF